MRYGLQWDAIYGTGVSNATDTQVLTWDETNHQWEPGTGGGGVADGDKGDIVVSGGGTVWTIDAGVVTAAKTSITGTPTGSKFLRDDWSWATPAGGPGGDTSISRTFLFMGA